MHTSSAATAAAAAAAAGTLAQVKWFIGVCAMLINEEQRPTRNFMSNITACIRLLCLPHREAILTSAFRCPSVRPSIFRQLFLATYRQTHSQMTQKCQKSSIANIKNSQKSYFAEFRNCKVLYRAIKTERVSKNWTVVSKTLQGFPKATVLYKC